MASIGKYAASKYMSIYLVILDKYQKVKFVEEIIREFLVAPPNVELDRYERSNRVKIGKPNVVGA